MKLVNLYEQDLPDIESPPEAAPAPEAPAEAPAPAPEAGGEAEAQQGYQGDDGYTLDMIIGQLRGIVKPWMSIASKFPEGDQRHNFMEIGERITEIANTIERDF